MIATTIPAIFSFNSSYDVRAIQINNEPWFVAADVCAAIGISRTDDGVSRLDDDEKGTGSIRTLGGTQEMTVINESGLYSLVLGSRKPEAKKFKKWVTSEVLPAIRKTGSYSIEPAKPAPKKILCKPAVDLYFAALHIYAGMRENKAALWIGLSEVVFSKLGIRSLDELTTENVDHAIHIVASDCGQMAGAMAARQYLPWPQLSA